MADGTAVEVLRGEPWDFGIAHDAGHDDEVEAGAPGKPSIATVFPAPVPPWPNRRLSEALAELGPARPVSAEKPEPAPAAEPVSDASPPRPVAPPPAPERAIASPEPAELPAPVAPPPPAEAPFDTLGELDILSAIAAVNAEPSAAALPPLGDVFALAGPAPTASPAPVAPSQLSALDDEDEERPPAIIERAIAEQQMGLAFPHPLPRLSPWPGLLTGFALSLVCGAALYYALAV
ncbi:MAG: hypothetical protein JSS20_01025 [Proteobacteria bacterium]|nr:hypothetical protein [Pseudomonadota bacterium]